VRLAPVRQTLATRGFRALVDDYDTAADPAGNVVKAAAKLRQLGCTRSCSPGLPGPQANLIVPVLFITAKGDRYGAAEATPQLYAAATKASPRRLEVVAVMPMAPTC
jgi:hypothetical protein